MLFCHVREWDHNLPRKQQKTVCEGFSREQAPAAKKKDISERRDR